MTELHAENLAKSVNEYFDAFGRARTANDWESAYRLWLKLMHSVDTVIREGRRTQIEADSLAAELEVYRPTRSSRPAAPLLRDFDYVSTAAAWTCVAVRHRKEVYIPALFGGGYLQEHYVPDQKTLCGKKTMFPLHERFESGGWPRLHELCPDCTRILVDRGLLAQ